MTLWCNHKLFRLYGSKFVLFGNSGTQPSCPAAGVTPGPADIYGQSSKKKSEETVTMLCLCKSRENKLSWVPEQEQVIIMFWWAGRLNHCHWLCTFKPGKWYFNMYFLTESNYRKTMIYPIFSSRGIKVWWVEHFIKIVLMPM